MIRPAARNRPVWSDVRVALALLAFALRLVTPAGFMPQSAPGLPFALVLCTAQGLGEVTTQKAAIQKAAIQKAGAEAPSAPPPPAKPAHGDCPFAGAAPLYVAAPSLSVIPAAHAPPEPQVLAAGAHPGPGRGLAAPPLPARGPPILTV